MRQPRQDERAVSTVIGAILIAGLLVTMLVTVRVSFVPVWEKEKESARATLVEAQLASLRSDLDRQVDNRSATALTHPFTLGETDTGLFGGPALPDRIEVKVGGSSVTTAADKMKIFTSNGVNVAGLNPQWEQVITTPTLEDIVSVQALRLRIADVGGPTQTAEDMNITVYDANDDLVGMLAVLVVEESSGYNIVVEVTDDSAAPGNILTRAYHSHFNAEFYDDYYIDALNPIYLFDQLLASAETPFRLELQHDPGFVTDYSISYVATTAGGSGSVTTSGGILRTPYSAVYTGGQLRYDTGASRFPQQTYIIENGALVLAQGEAAVFKVAPSFHVTRANDVTGISFTLPAIGGTATARSGTTNAIITSHATSHNDINGACPALTITITTQFPELWIEHWENEFDAAGFTSTQFSTSMPTATTAQLVASGVNTDADVFDVTFDLTQGTVALTIEV